MQIEIKYMKIKVSEKFIQNPLVSVVIPSYNRKEFVAETIYSILNQECSFDFEIVIGDDCSTDGVREVLLNFQQNFPEKIKLLFYDKNIGIAANWATCVKECRGKYIANCDNDDYWHEKSKIQKQVDFFEQNPEVGLLSTGCQTIDSNGKIKQRIISKYINGTLDELMRSPCNASIMYRADLLFKYVKLDDYITYQFTLQDWPTWLFLSKHTKFDCLPINATTVRSGNESVTRAKSYDAILKRMNKEKFLYKYMSEQVDFPYIEQDYDDYINERLLKLAFKKWDYSNAKEFAGKIADKTRQDKTRTKNILTFYIFCLLKKLKNIKK